MEKIVITNYEKACQMVGEGVADTLKEAGLITPDPKPAPTITAHDPRFEGATPTHWKVAVRVPQNRGTTKYVHSLPEEFKAVIMADTYPTSRYHKTDRAEKLYRDEKSAQRMATMAKNTGLDVWLIPCYLVPLVNKGTHYPN